MTVHGSLALRHRFSTVNILQSACALQDARMMHASCVQRLPCCRLDGADEWSRNFLQSAQTSASTGFALRIARHKGTVQLARQCGIYTEITHYLNAFFKWKRYLNYIIRQLVNIDFG